MKLSPPMICFAKSNHLLPNSWTSERLDVGAILTPYAWGRLFSVAHLCRCREASRLDALKTGGASSDGISLGGVAV